MSNRTILQSMLVADYEGLIRRLTRHFGSSDFASETLHETFARLDRIGDEAVVLSPKDYLFRTAINVGKNRRRAERLRASAGEIDAFLEIPDETPDSAQIIEGRSEMDALLRVLADLPPRMRCVFEDAFFHNRTYAEIADRLGVSSRTVERDIQQAIELCSRQLGYLPSCDPSEPRSRA